MKKQFLLLITAIAMLFSHVSVAQCVFGLEADKNVCMYPGSRDTVDVFYTITGGTPTSYSWTTSGSGTFSPYYGHAYKYSAADLTAGSVTLTATAHGGTCEGLTDQITVTFIRTRAGTDQTVCGNTANLSGAATSGFTYQWYKVIGSGTFMNSTALNTTYTASTADLSQGYALLGLRLTNNPSCVQEDTVRINFSPAPATHTSLNTTSCGNPTLVYGYPQYAQTYAWTTSGSGVFADATNDTTLYTPSAADLQAGGVALTLTGNKPGCPSSSSPMFITYVTSAQANAGPDQTVCGSNVLLNGSISGPSGGKWSSSGTGKFVYNPSYLINYYTFSAADIAAGSVTLTLTTTGNGSCAAASDQKTVSILAGSAVFVYAGPDQVSTGGAITLNGSITGSTNAQWSTLGSGTFSPSATSLNASYTPSSADLARGYVMLSLTSDNGNCGVKSDALFVVLGNNFNISGTVNAGSSNLDKGYIYLFKTDGTFLELFRKDSIVSGQNGTYNFQFIPNGSYVVYATPASTSAYYSSHLATYFGDVVNWEDATLLTVSNASYTGKNIALKPFTSAQPNWNTGNDTIAGAVFFTPPASSMRLIGATDIPLSNATVYLKKPTGEIIAYTTTNANGAYSFKKILSDNYLIEVEYPGAVMVGNSLNVATDGVASTIESGTVITTRQSIITGTHSSAKSILLPAYPNPAHDFVEMELTTSAAFCTVQITDAMGAIQAHYQETITNSNAVRISLDQFPDGIYMVQIIDGENMYTSKVVKY